MSLNAMRHYIRLSAMLFGIALLLMGPSTSFAQGDDLAGAYRNHATPLSGDSAELDPLVAAAGERRLVLLGESTHGTRQYYTLRGEISRRLIAEHGFDFVAVEGDWMSMARLDRYVRHKPGADASAGEALFALDQWPHWMWANQEFAAFAEWLHDYNRDRAPADRVGIHGMDVYAPWRAMDGLLRWYQTTHPDRLEEVRAYYPMFARYRDDPGGYAQAAAGNPTGRDGAAAVRALTVELWQATIAADDAGRDATQAAFRAKQKAAIVERAEQFYRTMVRSDAESWNWRASHMKETVARLLRLYGGTYGDDEHARGTPARGIVWAHNTHIGDARATIMVRSGRHNIGQLSRQAYGDSEVFLVGCATHEGSVLAARQWGATVETMTVPTPPPDSFEAHLRAMGLGDALILFPRDGPLPSPLQTPLGHRAIGVVYAPSHDTRQYVPSIPALRYDALVYMEATDPLTPLH